MFQDMTLTQTLQYRIMVRHLILNFLFMEFMLAKGVHSAY